MGASGNALGNVWLIHQMLLGGPTGRLLGQAGNVLIPNAIPEAGQIFAAYVGGWIDEGTLTKYLRVDGVKWDPNAQRTGVDFGFTPDGRIEVRGGWKWTDNPWQAGLWELWQRWDVATINQLLNRGVIDSVLADQILISQGWESGPERAALRDLRHPILPPVQLLEAAIRGGLNPANFGPGGLTAEYDDNYNRWAGATGLDKVQLPGLADGTPPASIDFRPVLWAMHWALPTMTQWFEIKRRLRPSIANPNISADPSGVIVDPALETPLYQANAVHPDWRAALRAISFKPVSLRYIDTLYEFGQLTRREVEDALISYGFAPQIAGKLATARADKVDRTRRKATLSAAKIQLEAAWELGSIDDQTFIDGLIAAGLFPQEAQQALTIAGIEHTRKRLDRSIKAIRQQVLTGQMSLQDAQSTLLTIGIQSGRVGEYVQDWSLDISGRRKLLSAGANLKAAADGLLPLDELVQRLRNLRYADADISIFLGELQLTLAERLARAAASAERAAERNRRTAERAVRQLQQAEQAARSALAKHGSPEKLKTWFCDGLITEDEVYARLRFLQWPDADIARLLEECAASNLYKPKKSTTNGTAGTQQGG